jgi:tetratricopeptide (TPR) repeat protein
MDSTWHLPDHESWRGEPGYNPQVATALGCAHQQLQSPKLNMQSYWDALDCLRPVLNDEMSARQRAHVLFIVALGLATQDKPTVALLPIDEAFELTLALDEVAGQLDLLLLRASVNRAISQVSDAVEDMRDYLLLLADGADQRAGAAPDPQLPMRVDATLHLAGSEWILGNDETCEQLLNHAAQLLQQAPGSELQVGLLAWTRALLYRWRGDLDQALIEGMRAAEIYTRAGAPNMASRIQGVVAEIVMDVAERYRDQAQPQASADFLTLAQGYAQRARDLAGTDETNASWIMAAITSVRLERLCDAPGDPAARVQRLTALANLRPDVAAKAQAYTELGREYEAAGDRTTAIAWYQRAVAILVEHKMVALAFWARRALDRLTGPTRSNGDKQANK